MQWCKLRLVSRISTCFHSLILYILQNYLTIGIIIALNIARLENLPCSQWLICRIMSILQFRNKKILLQWNRLHFLHKDLVANVKFQRCGTICITGSLLAFMQKILWYTVGNLLSFIRISFYAMKPQGLKSKVSVSAVLGAVLYMHMLS